MDGWMDECCGHKKLFSGMVIVIETLERKKIHVKSFHTLFYPFLTTST